MRRTCCHKFRKDASQRPNVDGTVVLVLEQHDLGRSVRPGSHMRTHLTLARGRLTRVLCLPEEVAEVLAILQTTLPVLIKDYVLVRLSSGEAGQLSLTECLVHLAAAELYDLQELVVFELQASHAEVYEADLAILIDL